MYKNLRFWVVAPLIATALLGIVSCDTSQKTNKTTNTGQPTASDFRAILEEVRAQYNLPALAATVFTRNEILAEDAVGVRNTDTKTRLNKTDKFHIGACSQAITVWVVAKLVEQGKLAWNSKPADVLGLRNNLRADYQDITLQDLLAHEAHIAPYNSPKAYAEAATFRQGTLTENRRTFVIHVLRQDPYTGTEPAAADYTIAAAMCEKVTNESWETLVNTMIFAPLGLQGEFGTLALRQKNAIFGHTLDTLTQKWQPYTLNEPMIPQVLAPYNDIDLSIGDYAKFLQENLKGIKGEPSLLTAKTVQFLHNYQKMVAHSKPTAETNQLAFEGAIAVNSKNNMTYIKSESPFFYANCFLFHRRNIGIAVFANCADDQGKTSAAVADLLRKLKARYALD